MSNHIDHIEITNFKSIRHAKIEGCKRINVFIGYPNVGKSNILEALGLFSLPYLKLIGSKKITEFIRLKNLPELFFNADIRNSIELKINHSEAYFKATYSEESSYPLECIFSFIDDNSRSTIKDAIKIYANHDLNARIENLSESVNDIFTTKKYAFSLDKAKQVKRQFDFLLPPNGNNLFDIINTNKELREFIQKQLERVKSEYIYDRGENVGRIYKRISHDQVYSLPYNSLADTLQRLIFYKAAISNNRDSVILFEEPEAHMFPPYISKFVWDVINNKTNGNQYFIATHSPFVINDLLEDVREDLSVYAVGYSKGQTTIKLITEEELQEIYQYGIDLFFNLEDYLENA